MRVCESFRIFYSFVFAPYWVFFFFFLGCQLSTKSFGGFLVCSVQKEERQKAFLQQLIVFLNSRSLQFWRIRRWAPVSAGNYDLQQNEQKFDAREQHSIQRLHIRSGYYKQTKFRPFERDSVFFWGVGGGFTKIKLFFSVCVFFLRFFLGLSL